MRRQFFGADASTRWQRERAADALTAVHALRRRHPGSPGHRALFEEYGGDIDLVVHAAAQPSHDWAARDPHHDFAVNATGTLTLLEATRQPCPEAVFVFTSTNKVYGDRPNGLPLVEQETRWEIDADPPLLATASTSRCRIDATTHSLFGASKTAADCWSRSTGDTSA